MTGARLFAGFMLAHGIAHLVGFAAAWKLINAPDVPYRTTILNGAFDLGATGIRAYGLAWVALALMFGAVAVALWFRAPWWYRGALAAAAVSGVFCVLSWPEARIGLAVNAAIATLVVTGAQLGWFPLQRAVSP